MTANSLNSSVALSRKGPLDWLPLSIAVSKKGIAVTAGTARTGMAHRKHTFEEGEKVRPATQLIFRLFRYHALRWGSRRGHRWRYRECQPRIPPVGPVRRIELFVALKVQ